MILILDEDSHEVGAGPGHAAAAADGSGEEVEEESVFTKLEKTRTTLETTLGLASLLEAYQLIQVYNHTVPTLPVQYIHVC